MTVDAPVAVKMEQFPDQIRAAAMNGSEPTASVWVVSLPFFSHLIHASELAESLAKHGLTVTLLGAEHDIQRLQSSRSQTVNNWKLQGLDLHLRPLASAELAAATGGPRKSGPFVPTVDAYEKILRELFREHMESTSKPTFVISDVLLAGRVESLAAQLDVPLSPFLTISPGMTAASVYMSNLEPLGILKLPYDSLDKRAQQTLIGLLGLPSMTLRDLPDYFRRSNPMYSTALGMTECLKRAENIILNIFWELEPRGCYELRKLLMMHAAANNSRKVPQIWTVGPLFPISPYNPETKEGRTGDERVDACIQFLDSQSPSSVVYVSFGIEIGLSREQILELVCGLERSKQPFLCVLHPPEKPWMEIVEDPVSVIPSDCLERIGSRGLFVEWAPQRQVLSHPSTGAFISHCGYGSLLESACFGVPVIAWPWQYDQFTDCRLLVDELQTALEVCPGLSRNGFVESKDVEKAINTLFHTDEGLALKNRALEMKQRAERSLAENGSSRKNMQGLVATIKGLAKLNQKI